MSGILPAVEAWDLARISLECPQSAFWKLALQFATFFQFLWHSRDVTRRLFYSFPITLRSFISDTKLSAGPLYLLLQLTAMKGRKSHSEFIVFMWITLRPQAKQSWAAVGALEQLSDQHQFCKKSLNLILHLSIDSEAFILLGNYILFRREFITIV